MASSIAQKTEEGKAVEGQGKRPLKIIIGHCKCKIHETILFYFKSVYCACRSTNKMQSEISQISFSVHFILVAINCIKEKIISQYTRNL